MLSNKIIADRPLAGNENRAHIHKSGRYQEMMPMNAGDGVAAARAPNDLPPSIRGDAPMKVNPHDGGAPNASAPTRVAIHTGPVTPGYKGVSPRVAAELYKALSAFAQRIRDHAKNK